MTITQILDVLRRRWSVLVGALLVGLAAAAATTAVLPPTYSSTMSIYVRAAASGPTAGSDSYTSNLLAQQLVTSYADLATSQRVLNGVIRQLGLNEPTTTLASHVDAEVQQNSTILDVTVSDRTPAAAARLTAAVGEQLTTAITQIEQNGSYTVHFSVVDRPVADTTPVSPRWPVNLAIGAALGLLLGVVVAAVQTATDRTLRSGGALAAAAGTRSLAVLPRERRSRRDGGRPGASDAYVAAVRRLRTALLLTSAADGATVVTVAGPRAGVGTTTLVRALAAAAAPTRRVLVVEGDLRDPSASADLELGDGAGLSEVLSGSATVATAVRSWRGAEVLTAGAPVEDSAAVLAAPALQQVLRSVRDDYDLVLIDAPPLGPSLDGMLLARLSDLTVLTGRAGTTTAEEIASAVDALVADGVAVAGTVLTFATGGTGRAPARAGRSAAGAEPRPSADGAVLPV